MDLVQSILRPNGRERVHSVEDGLKSGMSGDTLQHPQLHTTQSVSGAPVPITPIQRASTAWAPLEPSNQLATFRHLVGIHTTKSFVPDVMPGQKQHHHFLSSNLNFDGRAAPNVGIYNRVCHREQQAKRGYKFASVFINSCLGIQVIVAAALTAMGAAKSSHIGITAFGAINTVIAGLLTYLKGSGLPNRIKWYENEWKKVREFIEQRERDFSRPDCPLDVERVVQAIEAMYEEVKMDIQNNTPEMYISISDLRNRGTSGTTPHGPSLQELSKTASAKKSKLEELELKYGHKVTDLLENLAHKEEARLRKIEGDTVRGAKDYEKDMEERGRLAAERELEHARTGVRDFEKNMEDKGRLAAERELDHARTGARSWEERGARLVGEETEHARSSIFSKGVAFARDLQSARTTATERGKDYERELEAKAARLAEAEKELQREADRVRLATERAGDELQRAGNSIEKAGESAQRVGDSAGRIEKAVEDEITPVKRRESLELDNKR